MGIVEYARKKYQEIKRRRDVERGYQDLLKKQAEPLERQAYAKEYKHQVQLEAKKKAKARFQKPVYSNSGGLGSPMPTWGAIPQSSQPRAQKTQPWDVTGGVFNSTPKSTRNYKQPAWDVTAGVLNRGNQNWDVTGGVFNHKRRRR